MEAQSIIILNEEDISKILSKVIDIDEWNIIFKTYYNEYNGITNAKIEINALNDPKTIMDKINKIIEEE